MPKPPATCAHCEAEDHATADCATATTGQHRLVAHAIEVAGSVELLSLVAGVRGETLEHVRDKRTSLKPKPRAALVAFLKAPVAAMIEAGAKIAGSDAALGERIGVGRFSVSRLKHGKYKPSPTTIDRLRYVLTNPTGPAPAPRERRPGRPAKPVTLEDAARPMTTGEKPNLYVYGSKKVIDGLDQLARVHPRRRIGVVLDAMAEFIRAHYKKELPEPVERDVSQRRRIRVEPDALLDFDRLVLGADRRDLYLHTAVEQHVLAELARWGPGLKRVSPW
jgi:hypothetical protein